MVIFIEGPDCVGKDTLIKNIKNKFNEIPFHTLHYSNVNTLNVIEYSKKLYEQSLDLAFFIQKTLESGVMFSRSMYGEKIYGPLYRDYSGDYVDDLEKKYHFDEHKFLFLITLVDEPNRLCERDKKRGDNQSFSIDVEQKTKEINLFVKMHNESIIKNKLLINIHYKSAEDVLNEVIEFIANSY